MKRLLFLVIAALVLPFHSLSSDPVNNVDAQKEVTATNATPAITEPSAPAKTTLPPPTKATEDPYELLKRQEEVGQNTFMTDFINMLTTLGLILALIVAVSWLLKKLLSSRIEQMNEASAIKIVDRRNISSKTVLFLLNINGKGFLIADSSTGATFIGDVDLEKENISKFEALLQKKKQDSE